jgi:hypothetical protein
VTIRPIPLAGSFEELQRILNDRLRLIDEGLTKASVVPAVDPTNAGGARIRNVARPVMDTDALNVAFADSRYALKGETMAAGSVATGSSSTGNVVITDSGWNFGDIAADLGRPAILTLVYTPPSPLEDFVGVTPSYRVGLDGDVIPLPAFEYAGEGDGVVAFQIPAPNPAADVTVWLLTTGKETDDLTPFVVIPSVGGPLTAENAASVSVAVAYEGKFWGTSGSVAFGSDRESITSLYLVYIGPLTAGGDRIPGTTREIPWQDFRTLPASGNLAFTADVSFERGGSTTYWQLEARAYNYLEVMTENPTRSPVFAVNPLNTSTQATSPSVTVVKYKNADGMWLFRFTCVCTNANDSDYARTMIYIRKHLTGSFPAGTYADWQLYTASAGGGVGGGVSQTYEGDPIWSLESSNIYFQVAFRTLTTAGTERSSPPTVDVTVTPSAGGLRADRFDTGTLSSEFSIVGTVFGIANSGITGTKIADGSITTPKLSVTEIDVGGSAARPAKFRVFNTSGSIIGYIGTFLDGFTTFEGGWFKELRVGGNSAPNAKLIADSSGNLSIVGGTFTLDLNGITTRIANVSTTPGYAGLIVEATADTDQRTIVLAGHVGCQYSNALAYASLSVLSGYGYLALSNSSGTLTIQARGDVGLINAVDVSVSSRVDTVDLLVTDEVFMPILTEGHTISTSPSYFLPVKYGGNTFKIPAYLFL